VATMTCILFAKSVTNKQRSNVETKRSHSRCVKDLKKLKIKLLSVSKSIVQKKTRMPTVLSF